MAGRPQQRTDGARAAPARREAELIRRALKRTIERVLASPAVTRRTIHRVRGRRLILAYHGIIPADHGEAFGAERALFVAQGQFARQLDVLAEVADVAALDRIDEPESGRPRVAITFDDAYNGAVTAGIPELAARSLPATIFVAPGRLARHVFWWDALAGPDGVLDSRVRTHALGELNGDDERVRDWALRTGLPWRTDVPDFARSSTVEELQHAVRAPGITLGAHSWSHPALISLAPGALQAELERPRAWLAERFGANTIDWFAYPYGLMSPAVHAATSAAGYRAALAITGGWHVPAPGTRFARPRLTIGSGMSVDGFRARILGALRT